MVVILPALGAGGEGLVADLGLAALKTVGVLLGAFVLGARVVPWVLARAAVTRSRELFLLGVVAFALGTALVTQFAGLSLAFGAFLAGLVVAESELRTQVIAEVLPLRDLFASLFFVSVGMLINPVALLSDIGTLALLTAVVVVGKVLVVTVAVLLLGMSGRVALMAGLALAQVGEFSFVLARLGVDRGAIPQRLFDLTLATAVATIVLTPALLRAGPALLGLLERAPLIGHRFVDRIEADPEGGALDQHVVICGFGRVGRELADALEMNGTPYLVMEYSPALLRDLRARGVPVVYGDATNPAVIEHAHLDRATMLAVLVPDASTAELVTRRARADHPDLDIVARANNAAGVTRLQQAGATEVVQPEFEAGVEVIRHALRRCGVEGSRLEDLTADRRVAFYKHGVEEAATDGL
jgi:CPA2 family monovalent cation:H+ antiporter-2